MLEQNHEHGHNHVSSGNISPISKKWKYLTVYGNLALGVLELASGNFKTLSLAADGIHNIGDAITYNMQSNELIKRHDNLDVSNKRRKLSHYIIATTSGVVSLKAGIDLASNNSSMVSDTSLYIAGASLVFNSGLFLRLRQGINRNNSNASENTKNHHEDDLTKHFLAIDIPSAFLAVGGVIAQKHGFQDAEQIAALASGTIGMIAFRPTQKNLGHIHI